MGKDMERTIGQAKEENHTARKADTEGKGKGKGKYYKGKGNGRGEGHYTGSGKGKGTFGKSHYNGPQPMEIGAIDAEDGAWATGEEDYVYFWPEDEERYEGDINWIDHSRMKQHGLMTRGLWKARKILGGLATILLGKHLLRKYYSCHHRNKPSPRSLRVHHRCFVLN